MYGEWKLIVLALGAAGAGASALYAAIWGPRARARRRLAQGSAQLEDGSVVTLTGRVRALTTIEAPLSGAACVAYAAIGRVHIGAGMIGSGALSNEEPLADQALVPFELETAHGVVLVDAERADIVLPLQTVIPRKVDREAAFLAARGYYASDLRRSGFEQIAIVEGDRITVQGLVHIEQAPPTAGHGYRDGERRIRLVAHEAHPLTIGPA